MSSPSRPVPTLSSSATASMRPRRARAWRRPFVTDRRSPPTNAGSARRAATRPGRLSPAPRGPEPVAAPRPGEPPPRARARGGRSLGRLGALAIGTAAMRLGAGRTAKHDTIDHAVGIVCLRKRGGRGGAGDVLAEIHARDETAAEAVVGEVRRAYELVDETPAPRSVVLETLS